MSLKEFLDSRFAVALAFALVGAAIYVVSPKEERAELVRFCKSAIKQPACKKQIAWKPSAF